ncbi:radical SAM family heme chaperone HemW [bacterium]|nr:radical SAM family heme chaperone HemW [bacterium]
METMNQNFPSKEPTGERETHPLGVYVHIPYCKQKCHYCAFISSEPGVGGEIERYIQSVKKHVELGSKYCIGRWLESIYIGGGTPSFVGKQNLVDLFQTLHDSFSLKKNAEITVEVNPESASASLFEALVASGVNRISLGVQSFSDESLKRLGRIHNGQDVYDSVEHARKAGVAAVSMDLMFGLPGQSLNEWKDTLREATSFEPEHISVYGLGIEEGTPFYRWSQESKITTVVEETYVEMYHVAMELLKEAGYLHYEISNWCRPGQESRHNLLYWDRDDYLAFGVSAHGKYGGYRYAFIDDRVEYMELFNTRDWENQGLIPHVDLLKEEESIPRDAMASDAMIFGLRKRQGVSIRAFGQRFGYEPMDRWEAPIRKLEDRGLLQLKGGRLRLTQEALLISNEVFQEFLH